MSVLLIPSWKNDSDILDLLPQKLQNAAKKQDLGYQTIGKRVRYTLGPLSTLWRLLSAARQAKCSGDPLNVNKLIELVEQAVICLGQVSQSVAHQRRMNILTKFVANPKKCIEILSTND